MKNLIASIVLSLTATAALANGYCDSRPTEAARQACYRATYSQVDYTALAKQAVANMNTNIKAIRESALIPKAEKDEFLKGVDKSRKNIDTGCSDNKCVMNSVAQLNNRMVAFYNKYHQK